MTVGIRKLLALALVFLAAFASYYLIEAPLLRLDGPRLLQRLAARAVVPIRSGWTGLSQRRRERL